MRSSGSWSGRRSGWTFLRAGAPLLALSLLLACSTDGAGSGSGDGPASLGGDSDNLLDLTADLASHDGTPAEDTANDGAADDADSDLVAANDASDQGGSPDAAADAVADSASSDLSADPAPDSEEDTPAGSLSARILLLGPSGAQLAAIADNLETIAGNDPAFASLDVEWTEYSERNLLDFYYRHTDRSARLGRLSEGWDIVVVADAFEITTQAPELAFEGTRAVVDLIRGYGAVPALLMLERVETSFLTPTDGQICEDLCFASSDGDCDDGGPDADYSACSLGSDCSDCGPRAADDDPAALLLDRTYRIANGAGVAAVPASYALHRSEAGEWLWPLGAAASLYSALVDRNASQHTAELGDFGPAEWQALSRTALQTQREADRTSYYEGPFEGVVRLAELDPLPSTFRVMTSGTSSEAGYANAMRALLSREGITAGVTEIGSCNDFKSFDETCLTRAGTHFASNQFQILYARDYEMGSQRIREAGGQPGLQVQVYDRHWDGTPNDGLAALDSLYDRTRSLYFAARSLDLTFLPQHLNFARLAVERPGTALLSDGTHATGAVQAGLAAMSFVARTGRSPDRSALTGETEAAVRLGELTIRQLATLSRSGEHVPDVPAERPRLGL